MQKKIFRSEHFGGFTETGSICRSFVNNVSYIKILSPEDVQKLGKQGSESGSPNAGPRISNSGADGRGQASGVTSLGSLEY